MAHLDEYDITFSLCVKETYKTNFLLFVNNELENERYEHITYECVMSRVNESWHTSMNMILHLVCV